MGKRRMVWLQYDAFVGEARPKRENSNNEQNEGGGDLRK